MYGLKPAPFKLTHYPELGETPGGIIMIFHGHEIWSQNPGLVS
jgi:hypothetical protein